MTLSNLVVTIVLYLSLYIPVFIVTSGPTPTQAVWLVESTVSPRKCVCVCVFVRLCPTSRKDTLVVITLSQFEHYIYILHIYTVVTMQISLGSDQ